MANGIAIKDVETKLQSLTGEEVIPISSGANEPEVVEASVLKEYAQGGTYKKPSGGIPKTDLASGVQSSLNKADTAVQIEIDPTVPSWAKAESKPSYTASEVGAVPTTRKVNNKALSDDITLIASDVGALPDNTIIPDAQIQSDWNQIDNTKKDYIKNKPTIPAAQIQSDWNQSTTAALDYIKNKPTIPTVPTNVSAFNNDAGYLTSHQDISGKADKATSATNGNFAALDSNGNLTDSGHKHSDYLTSHQDLSNYVQKSNTTGLLKNDGSVDTNTYLTSAPVTSVNGQTGAVSLSIPTVPSNIVTGLNSSGVATAYTIKVVDSLPSTTDPSTIYLVTGS